MRENCVIRQKEDACARDAACESPGQWISEGCASVHVKLYLRVSLCVYILCDRVCVAMCKETARSHV